MFNIFGTLIGRKTRYHFLTKLSGPRDSVQALSFSSSSRFLAAAGYGGIYVWTLNAFERVSIAEKPTNPEDDHSLVYTAVKWIFFEQGARHVLLVGSIKGTLELWDYREDRSIFESCRATITHPSNEQVVSMDVSQVEIVSGHRALIAVSYSDRSVALYTLNRDGDLKIKFSVKTPGDFLPKTVCFDPASSNIYAFAFYGGSIALLDSTGNVVWLRKDGPKTMASVSVHLSSNCFALCGDSTFELFQLDPVSPIRELTGPTPNYSLPKQIVFMENGSKLVAGSDRGYANIYDVRTGKDIQRLKYSKGGLVQPVATTATNERHLVAIAGSNSRQACDILLWQKSRTASAPVQQNDELFVISFKKSLLRRIFYFLVALAAVIGYTVLILYCFESIHEITDSVVGKAFTSLPYFQKRKPSFEEKSIEQYGGYLKAVTTSQPLIPAHTGYSKKRAVHYQSKPSKRKLDNKDVGEKGYVIVPDLRGVGM